MKNYLRYFLYGLLVAVGLFLWNSWKVENNLTIQNSISNKQTISNKNAISSHQKSSINSNVTKSVSKDRMIQVKTDVLNVKIDTLGGNVVEVSLPKYPETLKSEKPFLLLNNDNETLYLAKCGLLTSNNDNKTHQLQFHSDQNNYNLKTNQKSLAVKLTAINTAGIKFTKTYTFYPNQYAIQNDYLIKNQSSHNWNGRYYMQFTRKNSAKSQGALGMRSFFGVAISSPSDHYQKFSFKNLAKENISEVIKGGWLAMIQHYFLGAWVPNPAQNYHYYSRSEGNDIYSAGIMSDQLTLQPSQSISFSSQLYAGPKIADQLDALSPHLSLAIDYGHLWFIAVLLFWMLKHIYNFVGNWGWSIIILTVLIKLAFYHLSASSYKSMAGMRKLQPKLTALKERYGSDKQAMSKGMMALYKKEKINPLGGCLPILIQIPVFFALYWVLLESVELRQAPFIFWIHDLALKDPYYVLPILMGVSMFIQQKLSPKPADPTQEKIMLFLPIMMTVLFLAFPAGLVLYWLVNNILSILQQWYVMVKFDKGGFNKKKSARKKR